MKRTKKAVRPGTAITNSTNESYTKPSGESTRLPQFPDDVKRRWIVRRDAGGQEYIRLNGQNALGANGADHVYLIAMDRVGAWISSKRIASKIRKLTRGPRAFPASNLEPDRNFLQRYHGNAEAPAD